MNQRDTINAKELEKYYSKKDKTKFKWRIMRNKIFNMYGLSIIKYNG